MIDLQGINPFRRRTSANLPIQLPSAGMKRIVCLANSRKRSGRCVAGKLFDSPQHEWIRPVSARPDQEISRNELTLTDGTEPRLLDILDIPLQSPQPKDHQKENWLLAPRPRWNRVSRASWGDLASLIDSPDSLWTVGSHTHEGWHDRVSRSECQMLHCSLYFLHFQHLKLRVFTPGTEYGKTERRIQGKFRYKDIYYRLWITDPRIERLYARRPDGEYEIQDCFGTISLSEPLLGFCYKLIASVIVQNSGTT